MMQRMAIHSDWIKKLFLDSFYCTILILKIVELGVVLKL